MTAQEIFNIVALHLFNQQAGSFDENYEHCLYRNDDGLKCAIGCLIPDEKYSEDMEGDSSENIPFFTVEDLLTFPFMEPYKGHSDLLNALQDAHDSCSCDPDEFWDECKPQLIKVAKKFNLMVPEEIL